jgi:hypothetical protein
MSPPQTPPQLPTGSETTTITVLGGRQSLALQEW